MALPKNRASLPNPESSQRAEIPIYHETTWNFDGLAGLPGPFSRESGVVPDDIRRQMLDHPKIYQGINNLKSAILEDGGRVVAAVSPTHADWELARDIAQCCEFALRQMKGSWYVTARQLLDAVHQGNKVAAKSVREQESGAYRGYWMPDALQLLPNRTYRFLRDKAGNITHLRVRVVGEEKSEVEFERERFTVFTFRPIDGNILGTTVCPALYEPYYKDVQLDPEEMANIAQFGRPTVVVIAPGANANGQYPPDVPIFDAQNEPILDENNEQMRITVTADIAAKLAQYEAGSVVVLPGGSQFKLAEPMNGGGDAIGRVRASNERRMMAVIMGTDQLTESSNQLSSDNKGIAQDVAGLGITDGKRALEEMVESDIFQDIVRYNFGDAAMDLLPIFDLGSNKNARLIGLMNAVSAYINNGAFDEDQYRQYCKDVGLPMPNPDAKKVVDPALSRGSGGAHGNQTEEQKVT